MLFDEIEKAHPEVWNALLQILDDGRLTDGQGNVVDFRNTILIMTSNLGTEYVTQGRHAGLPAARPITTRNAKRTTRSRRRSRAPSGPSSSTASTRSSCSRRSPSNEMEQIVDLQMKEVQDRLNEYNIKVELTEAARKWLAKEGYDPAFGARPLRRAIQKYVESPLSVELLGGAIPSGSSISVDTKADGSGLEFKPKESKSKKKESETLKDGRSNDLPSFFDEVFYFAYHQVLESLSHPPSGLLNYIPAGFCLCWKCRLE